MTGSDRVGPPEAAAAPGAGLPEAIASVRAAVAWARAATSSRPLAPSGNGRRRTLQSSGRAAR